MKKKTKLAVKFTAFLLIVCLCVNFINKWFVTKYYYNQDWPSTETYKEFYKLKKNSTDVLFFGSSHAVTAFNPQVIYDQYGITSYNLACEQQSPLITYYWLREALKYQSPKVVVLDTYTLHTYIDRYVWSQMNMSEGTVRKPMDAMKWSPLKVEASHAIANADPSQSALSYTFTNIRYHDRWKYLNEDDYTMNRMINHGGIKGYSFIGGGAPDLTYTPFKDKDSQSVEAEKMVDTSAEYLDKITDLCKQKKINLVLVNIPCGESIARYKSTKDWSEKHDVPFYDFNEEKLYKEINYDAAKDNLSHINYDGASKVSSWLGNLFVTKYNVKPRKDSSFVSSDKLYRHKLENFNLTQTTDMGNYLNELDHERYSIFVYIPTSVGKYINAGDIKKFNDLGFKTDLSLLPDGNHYLGVRDQNKVTEKILNSDYKFSGTVRKGLTSFSSSVDTTTISDRGWQYSLTINGTECGNNNPGIDIVVFDKEEKQIIDKINFNTSISERTCSRY